MPKSDRKSFGPMFFIMLGFTFFSSSMSVGATLGNGLDFRGFLISVLVGSAILSVYTGFLAYIGCNTGLSFDQLGQRCYGKKGSLFTSAVICITQIGWFGVGVAMLSDSIAQVLGVNRIVILTIAGLCMTASAYFGIKGMEIISYISVPLIAILGVWSMTNAINSVGGLSIIFSRSKDSISLVSGMSLVIGAFISGGTTTPNFARFAKSSRIAVFTTVQAFFFGNILMFSFGAVGGAFTGKDDIFYVMMAQGLIIPALAVLGANVWTTNDNTLYSAGLGLSNITGVRKKPLVIVAGVIGTVASIFIYNYFVQWLVILNCILPPIGAVIITDYFTGKKRREKEEEVYSGIKWGSIISVVAGALTGIFVKWGIAAINSIVISTAVYCFFYLKFRDSDSIIKV